METTLRAYDRAGNRLGTLPWSALSRTIVRNAAGALSATVPKSLLTETLLGDEVYLRVAENGVESTDWYLLDDDGDDDTDAGGAARPVSIGASGAAAILEWGTVYSWEYKPGVSANLLGLDPNYPFADKTPGFILKTLIDAAKARGCFPHLTYSFDADNDSAGQPWTTTYSRTYELGTTIGKVLSTMAEDGWADWEMVGFRLDAYNTDVADGALAQDYPQTVLRLGHGVTQAPRKRTRKTNRSVILANGAEGNTIEVSDPAALARMGRREQFEGRSGVTDVGTLVAASQQSLSKQTSASESITLELVAALAPSLPRPGGYIRYDQRRLDASRLEPLRVQSIAWEYGDAAKVSVELADLWVDRGVRLERRIDALLNGSSANERVPVPDAGDDHVGPSTPTGLSLVTGSYMDQSGHLAGSMTATWNRVTTDADGSAIDDLRNYELQWRQTDVSSATFSVSTPNVVELWSWSPVVPNTLIDVRIRALDRYGNPSDWSAWVSTTTGKDETGPTQPSTPKAANYLGLLRIQWDGKFAGGIARPADFSKLEVHVSPVNNFTIPTVGVPLKDGGTLAGSIFAPGYVYADVPYTTNYYVKFRAFDVSGNVSPVSAQFGPVQTTQAGDMDIGNLQVGKLTGGTISVDITLSGRIATGDRGLGVSVVELNSLGIYRWDAADNQTVAIDDTGVLLVGQYKTATSGRRIEMGSAGTIGQLVFYAPDGGKQTISSSSWTQGNGSVVETLAIRSGTQSLIQLTEANAIGIFAWDASVIFRDQFQLLSNANDAIGGVGQKVRFSVEPSNSKTIVWDNAAGARLDVYSGSGSSSPAIRMWNNTGGGGAWRYLNDASGARYQALSWDLSIFIKMEASNLSLSSDVRGKTDITEVSTASLLDQVRAAPVRKYRRKGAGRQTRVIDHATGKTVVEEVNAPEELGLIAQEVQRVAPLIVTGRPEDEHGLFIDLYGMAATTWGALQELAAQVDQLKRGKP